MRIFDCNVSKIKSRQILYLMLLGDCSDVYYGVALIKALPKNQALNAAGRTSHNVNCAWSNWLGLPFAVKSLQNGQ